MTARVFWTVALGFLLGVFARSFLPLSISFIFLFALLAAACLFIALVHREVFRTGLLIACLCASFAVGMARMDVAALSDEPTLSPYLDKKITIEGTVGAEPDVRETSVRLNVKSSTVHVDEAISSIKGGVLVVAPPHTEVAYGDTIRATGILRVPKRFDTGEGRQFAYPEYLAMQGMVYELSHAEIEAREEGEGNYIKTFAINLKQMFLGGIGAALGEPAAGLAGGITVGDKRSIGKELSEDFQTVGLIHIIVLSGYNITIVLNAAAWRIMRMPILKHMRFAQLGVSSAIIALFVLMSDGASAAARAGAMAMIGVYARTSGRIFLASRALAAAALLLVLWNPFVLAFDPGFQLSMIATLGLIVFTPLFATRLQWIPEKFALREIAASTLGTQLAVLPLLLYQNGQLPMYALPANLLTLAFMPLAMLFSLIAGVAGILFGSFAIPIALPAYLILEYIILVAQIIADLPYAAISIGAFGAGWLFAAYAIIFLFAARLHVKRSSGARE